jgi:hypothetical protein
MIVKAFQDIIPLLSHDKRIEIEITIKCLQEIK